MSRSVLLPDDPGAPRRTSSRVTGGLAHRSSRRGAVTGALLGVALALGAGGFGAGAASAHSVLISTDPADGSTVDTAPDAVSLVFNEPAIELGTQVVVTGPDGQDVADGPVQLADNSVTQPLAAQRPAGDYHVEWRVTSADGHPIEGEFTFVASEAVGAPEEAAPESTESTEPTQDPEADATDGVGSTDAGATEDPAGSTDDATDDATDGATDDVGATDDDALPVWLLVVLGAVAVALGVLAALMMRSRRPRGAGDGPGAGPDARG